MASGDAVVQVLATMPPGSDAATILTRAGGSTPAENVVIYTFDAAASEYMDWLVKLEGYDNNGLTFTLPWSAATATSNQVRWEAAIRRMEVNAEDIDASHSYQFNGVSTTCADVSGEIVNSTITFTHGSDMDSWAEGELAILRLYRDHDHGDDQMTGDAELWGAPLGLET